MSTLYRARHRRPLVFGQFTLADAPNTATCSKSCARGIGVTMCPRHDAPGYSEYAARHATDSL